MTMKNGNGKRLSVKKWKTKMWYGLIIKYYMTLKIWTNLKYNIKIFKSEVQ